MKTTAALAVLLSSALTASAALAQGSPSPAPSPTQAGGQFITQLAPGQHLASDLMGRDVHGSNNEEIGEIDDMILDRSGRVVAYVIEYDAPGMGDREIAVPANAIRMGTSDVSATGSVQNNASGQSRNRSSAEDRVMITIPAEQLQAAPEFDHDD